MKITLLEPLGIPAEVLAQYQAKLEAMGHTFVSYDTKTADPPELTARTGDSDIAIIANTPYPASVVEAAPNLKLLDVAFTGIDHVGLSACKGHGLQRRRVLHPVRGGAGHRPGGCLPAFFARL